MMPKTNSESRLGELVIYIYRKTMDKLLGRASLKIKIQYQPLTEPETG